jgi:hypothetical protein
MSARIGERRRRLALLLALTGAAAVVALAVVTAGGSASHPGSQTLRFGLVTTSFHFLDNPPRSKARPGEPSISAGDAYVETEKLLNESGRRVGTAHLHCVATRGGRRPDRASFQCAATAKLRDGDITGAMTYRGEQRRVAVTGGTGAFEGARGSISFAEKRVGRRRLLEAAIHLFP